MKTVNRISLVFLLTVGVLFVARSAALTLVKPYEVGVRYNNALGLLEEDLQPGWHLEIVGLQKVWRLPTYYLFISYDEYTTLSIRTKDNNTVNVDVSVPYRIKPGHAWKIIRDGNHLEYTPKKLRFQRLAEQTATSVLREKLAQLQSEDFYKTDRRLEVADETLNALNEKLASYHLEAETVLVRAAYFREQYENQLARIQLNEQQKLLDGAKQEVAEKRQQLDNYEQETNALVSAKEQDWAHVLADLDRAYQVGFIDTKGDDSPGAARRALNALSESEREKLMAKGAEVLGRELTSMTENHLLGIKNITAETQEYSLRVKAEANGIAARLKAEGEAKIAKVRGAYEARLNRLLDSPAGRAYVAYHAASNIKFADELTFQSRDGIPSVLRLGDFAKEFMGR